MIGPAASAAGTTPRRRPAPAFPSTRRWLRGRILELAREASDGSWVVYDDAIGQHPAGAVRESVLAMAGEGLLEVREGASGVPEARLPG